MSTNKTHITQTERLALVGLLTLAGQQSDKLEATREAVIELLGEENEFGHCSDAVYDDGCRDADRLLGKLHITVLKTPPRPTHSRK